MINSDVTWVVCISHCYKPRLTTKSTTLAALLNLTTLLSFFCLLCRPYNCYICCQYPTFTWTMSLPQSKSLTATPSLWWSFWSPVLAVFSYSSPSWHCVTGEWCAGFQKTPKIFTKTVRNCQKKTLKSVKISWYKFDGFYCLQTICQWPLKPANTILWFCVICCPLSFHDRFHQRR